MPDNEKYTTNDGIKWHEHEAEDVLAAVEDLTSTLDGVLSELPSSVEEICVLQQLRDVITQRLDSAIIMCVGINGAADRISEVAGD